MIQFVNRLATTAVLERALIMTSPEPPGSDIIPQANCMLSHEVSCHAAMLLPCAARVHDTSSCNASIADVRWAADNAAEPGATAPR